MHDTYTSVHYHFTIACTGTWIWVVFPDFSFGGWNPLPVLQASASSLSKSKSETHSIKLHFDNAISCHFHLQHTLTNATADLEWGHWRVVDCPEYCPGS